MSVEGQDERLAAQDSVIERVRAVMRPLGYAVGVHGSRERDLDLIAAPWVEDAEPDGTKIAEAFQDADFVVGMGQRAEPHNRLGFALHGASPRAGVKYVDLSVLLPSREAALVEALKERQEAVDTAAQALTSSQYVGGLSEREAYRIALAALQDVETQKKGMDPLAGVVEAEPRRQEEDA